MKKSNLQSESSGGYRSLQPAIEANGMIFVSGQLPIDAATGQMAEGAEAQARQSLENVKHILGEAGLTMANIVKTTVFLQDMSLFADMNKVYATYFDGDFPCSFGRCSESSAERCFSGDRVYRSSLTDQQQ